MTNPPVPATPLDVEACVREAAEAIEGLFVLAHRSGCLWLNDHRIPCQCGSAERERAAVLRARRAAEALRHALASALPGIGKKADWYDWLADEDHVDWVRRLGNGNFAVETPPFGMKPDIERATLGECIDAARAAQPQETSADERP